MQGDDAPQMDSVNNSPCINPLTQLSSQTHPRTFTPSKGHKKSHTIGPLVPESDWMSTIRLMPGHTCAAFRIAAASYPGGSS